MTNDRFAKAVAAGDYDNDGDLDLYVSNRGVNRLYRNTGDATFDDVAAQAGVTGPHFSFVSWFFDYDNDGWLDLFVNGYDGTVHDVARDTLGLAHGGTVPALYRNNGDGTFTDVAAQLGLQHVYLTMGANFGDLNGDGFLDIYLGTGKPSYETAVPNAMLLNVGGKKVRGRQRRERFRPSRKGSRHCLQRHRPRWRHGRLPPVGRHVSRRPFRQRAADQSRGERPISSSSCYTGRAAIAWGSAFASKSTSIHRTADA